MILLLIILAVASWTLREYWMRLGDDSWKGRFLPWVIRGLALPALVWAAVNIGFGDRYPPLVPALVDAQQAGRPWALKWAAYSLGGALVVSAHWLSVSYAWLFLRIGREARERKEFIVTSLVFGLPGLGLAALFVYFHGSFYIGWVVAAALLPVIHFTADLAEYRPPMLSYSRAVAQLKFGRYKDAELEVISQLEKSESDFEGWMMLAELYARQYRNLDDAARVIHDLCEDPQTHPSRISIACDKLADWQIEIAANPLGARAALELMIRKIPGTHFAWMAHQRLRQIPQSVEDFDESRKPRRIRLPVLREDAFHEAAPPPAPRDQAAAAEANRLSAALTDNPNDILARHKLALVMVEKLGKIDLGVEQLRLLLAMNGPSDEQKAQWCAEIAKWEYHRTRDVEKLSEALRGIIREYPQTSQGFAAQRQLSLLEWEVKHQPSTA